MEKTNQKKTEAELHADLVVEHLNDLEGIKAEVIKKEHFEAAEVITKSIALIRSSHISNDYLAKENAVLKANLRIHLAGLAMSGMLTRGDSNEYIPERAFGMADQMLECSKEGDDT